MKKALLVIGIILIVAAVICFGVSLFFNFVGGSVMDASNDFIHRAFERSILYRNCGIGLAALGILSFVIHWLKFGK